MKIAITLGSLAAFAAAAIAVTIFHTNKGQIMPKGKTSETP